MHLCLEHNQQTKLSPARGVILGRRKEALHQIELPKKLDLKNPAMIYSRGTALIQLQRFTKSKATFEQL